MMLTTIKFTPPIITRHINHELGYSLAMPSDWVVDEHGLTATNKEVRFYPQNAEPFVSYRDIGLDPRSLEVLKSQNVPIYFY